MSSTEIFWKTLEDLSPYEFCYEWNQGSVKAEDNKIIVSLIKSDARNKNEGKLRIILPNNKHIDIQKDANIRGFELVEKGLRERNDMNNGENLNEIFEKDLLAYLILKKFVENRFEFLEVFSNFLNDIPESTIEIKEYYEELGKIFTNKTDIDSEDDDFNDIDENDTRFEQLEKLHEPMLKSLEKYKEFGEKYGQRKNETKNEAKNKEDAIDDFELPGFSEQSKKIKLIFQTLNKYERGDELAEVLDEVAESLKMNENMKFKMKSFFQINANSSSKTSTKDDKAKKRKSSIESIETKKQENANEMIKDLDQLLDELKLIDNKNDQLKSNLKSDCARIETFRQKYKSWSQSECLKWYEETRQNG
jgi:hypothetical protein